MTSLKIEVAFATRRGQEVVEILLEEGARAIDAVLASGLADRHPEIRLDALALGVYGKVVHAQTLLQTGDRVEIYRPLVTDPKDARRARAALLSRKRK